MRDTATSTPTTPAPIDTRPLSTPTPPASPAHSAWSPMSELADWNENIITLPRQPAYKFFTGRRLEYLELHLPEFVEASAEGAEARKRSWQSIVSGYVELWPEDYYRTSGYDPDRIAGIRRKVAGLHHSVPSRIKAWLANQSRRRA
ncbi:unnamed protein product [Peniophora sp. CBMAI 1063]|nr:unnamed protein product [Peniophora sp. CBMAI 1063]